MAHFAEIGINNTVLRVIVVSNSDCQRADGTESEEAGAHFCRNLFGGTWLQTSYNGNMRKNYAGVGYVYDSVRDAFIPQKPFLSWVLNEDSCQWQAPVDYPSDGLLYTWDEVALQWVSLAT